METTEQNLKNQYKGNVIVDSCDIDLHIEIIKK